MVPYSLTPLSIFSSSCILRQNRSGRKGCPQRPLSAPINVFLFCDKSRQDCSWEPLISGTQDTGMISLHFIVLYVIVFHYYFLNYSCSWFVLYIGCELKREMAKKNTCQSKPEADRRVNWIVGKNANPILPLWIRGRRAVSSLHWHRVTLTHLLIEWLYCVSNFCEWMWWTNVLTPFTEKQKAQRFLFLESFESLLQRSVVSLTVCPIFVYIYRRLLHEPVFVWALFTTLHSNGI